MLGNMFTFYNTGGGGGMHTSRGTAGRQRRGMSPLLSTPLENAQRERLGEVAGVQSIPPK